MSAQATILASQQDDGAMVDAYVDSLLAMPLSPPSPSPSAPAVEVPTALAEPEPEVLPASDAGCADAPQRPVAMEAEAAIDVDALPEADARDLPEPDVDAWPDDDVVFDHVQPSPAVAAISAGPEAASQPLQQAIPAARAPTPMPPMAEPEEDRVAVAAPVGQRWLRVAVGDDRYAVELLRVQEVVRLAPVIAVRGAVPSLLGVMNLRGRVVPVHDLGRWLRRRPVEPDERARIVVLEHQDELVGLMVTAVTDVVTLDTPQIEPPPPGVRDRIGMGIARTPGAPPTVLLDARVVFD